MGIAKIRGMGKGPVSAVFHTFLFAVLGLGIASAQGAVETVEKTSAFSIDTMLNASTSMHERSQADHKSEMQLWLTPALQVTENWKASAVVIITQNLENEMGVTLSDVELGVRRKGWELNPFLKFSPGFGVKIPASKNSITGNSFRGSIGVKPRLLYDLSSLKVWGLNAIKGFYQLSGARNFHEYNTSIKGVSNSQYSLANILRTGVSLSEKLSLSFENTFIVAWTYAGATKSTFEMGQEVGFAFTESFALGVGHNNSGNMFKENGLDTNLQFFDANNSTFYVSAAFKL